MKQFTSFVIKEAKHILRDKRTMLLLFGMPLVLMLLFGFAITTDVRNVRTLVVMSNADHATRQAVERLSQSEYFTIVNVVATPQEAEHLIRYATQVLLNPSVGLVNSKMLYNPQTKSAYNFVPAIMGMLLMLVCALMTSISIVREKEKGTMEVLLVSPMRPLMIIIAKAVPYLVLAFLILTIILLMAKFVLGVPLAGSLTWIILISVIYILLALSLGLLVSNVAKTQLVALLVCAMVLLMPIVMLSGMIFPVESMPEILQWVSAVIPPRYYISAMRKLMIMGVGIDQVLFELSVLTGMLVILMSLSLITFKKRLE